MLRSYMPRLYSQFELLGVTNDMFLPEAWLTLFSRWLPFALLFPAFEFLESEGLAGLISITSVLLCHRQEELVAAEDFPSFFVMLKTLGRPSLPSHSDDILDVASGLWLVRARECLPKWPHHDSMSISDPDSLGSNPGLVRKGSRVILVQSNLELLDNDLNEDTLHDFAIRNSSKQSPGVASPVISRANPQPFQRPLPAAKRTWFFNQCMGCCQSEAAEVEVVTVPECL